MRLQNKILYVEPTVEQTDLKELHQYLLDNGKGIEAVKLDSNYPLATSGLISLVISMINSDEGLDVDFLQRDKEIYLSGIGDLEIKY